MTQLAASALLVATALLVVASTSSRSCLYAYDYSSSNNNVSGAEIS
jgi:hypothetical protein